MLFLIYKANHPDLNYDGGQDEIIHLEADLQSVVAWAKKNQRKWAFTDCNAGAHYALFFNSLADLNKINWHAVEATDFQNPVIKEGKQAEFLLYESFPWPLVERIGITNSSLSMHIKKLLKEAEHKPIVSVEPTWYFS